MGCNLCHLHTKGKNPAKKYFNFSDEGVWSTEPEEDELYDGNEFEEYEIKPVSHETEAKHGDTIETPIGKRDSDIDSDRDAKNPQEVVPLREDS